MKLTLEIVTPALTAVFLTATLFAAEDNPAGSEAQYLSQMRQLIGIASKKWREKEELFS